MLINRTQMEPQPIINIICLSAFEYETTSAISGIEGEPQQLLQLAATNCDSENVLQLTFEEFHEHEEPYDDVNNVSIPKTQDVLETAIREIGDTVSFECNNWQEGEEGLDEEASEETEDQALTWDERIAAVKALLALSKPKPVPLPENINSNTEIKASFDEGVLKCPVCFRYFKRRYDLKIHLNIHFKLRRCICEICGKEFHHKSNLIRHMRGHNGTKPYKCSLCSKRFTQSTALHNHRESAHSETTVLPFTCFCGKSFKSSGVFRSHRRKAHPGVVSSQVSQSPRKSYCPVCGLCFETRLDLRSHEKDHAEQGTLSCTACLQSFSRFAEWRQHKCEKVKRKSVVLTVPPVPLVETSSTSPPIEAHDLHLEMPLLVEMSCNNEADSELLSIGLSSVKLPELRTTDTSEEAKTNDTLSDSAAFDFEALCQVLGVWNGEKEVCKDRMDLEEQIESSSSIIPTDSAVINANVIEHESLPTDKEILKKETEFACQHCKKVFKKQDTFNNHLATHDKSLRQYKCTLCDETFAFQRGLSGHLRQEHNQSLSFSCPHCSKAYNSRTLLNDHLRRDHIKERSFGCSSCEKVFFKKSDLTVHLRTHQKERPYCCSQCGKQFGHVSHVLRHELIHAGERPYKCDFLGCDKAFNQSSSLKKHKLTHAPKVKKNKFSS